MIGVQSTGTKKLSSSSIVSLALTNELSGLSAYRHLLCTSVTIAAKDHVCIVTKFFRDDKIVD